MTSCAVCGYSLPGRQLHDPGHPFVTVDDLFTDATTHDLIRQTGLSDNVDPGDRWGSLMQIGFVICDALTVRGEDVPAQLKYRPALGLYTEEDRAKMADDLSNLDAEEAEAKYPDLGDLYFAWGLGLGDNVMGGWDADAIRDYLTDVWQPAYDALVAAGEDY